jgi:hypothetical protein
MLNQIKAELALKAEMNMKNAHTVTNSYAIVKTEKDSLE